MFKLNDVLSVSLGLRFTAVAPTFILIIGPTQMFFLGGG